MRLLDFETIEEACRETSKILKRAKVSQGKPPGKEKKRHLQTLATISTL